MPAGYQFPQHAIRPCEVCLPDHFLKRARPQTGCKRLGRIDSLLDFGGPQMHTWEPTSTGGLLRGFGGVKYQGGT